MSPMKTTLAAAALALLAVGCRAPVQYHGDPEQDAYDFPRTQPLQVGHEVEVPAGKLQYLAMSADNRYALCPWTENRSEAEAAGRAFESKHPGLDWYVLWRQKPSW